jgi:hypothetical protein
MKRLMAIPFYEVAKAIFLVGIPVALATAFIAGRQAAADALFLWRHWRQKRRARKPRPDTDYGLKDTATVETFIGVLHGDESTTPPLHHTGETPLSRRTTPRVLHPLDDEETVPMLPDGVHGFRIGHRPVEPVLVRSAPEPPAVATPIFDALALQWRTRADAVAFEWLTTLTEERRVEVAA